MTIEQIVDDLGALTAPEVIALTKRLEAEWGVSSKIPDILLPPVIEKPVEEQIEFSLKLVSFGTSKMQVIKELRLISKLGLMEAKTLVESAPVVVLTNLNKLDAERAKKQLESVGSTIEYV